MCIHHLFLNIFFATIGGVDDDLYIYIFSLLQCVLESCNKPRNAEGIYCSNECVLKHAQLSLKILGKTDKVCLLLGCYRFL